jgi:hypothetical protein
MCIYHDARWQLDENASWTKKFKETNKKEKIIFKKWMETQLPILWKFATQF